MADISTTSRDKNNIVHLTSNSVVAMKYVDISASRFANPDLGYNGFAADGLLRTAGVASSTKASWATEGEHTTATANRGLEDAFPKRIFVITTATEVVILDADDLAVWIRFTRSASSAFSAYSCLGGSTTVFVDADFSEGVLSVAVSDASVADMNGLVIVDFRNDLMVLSGAPANAKQSDKNISQRNAADAWNTTSATVTGIGQKSAKTNSVSMLTEQNLTYIVTGHPDGLTLLKLKPSTSGYATAIKKTQAFEKPYSGVNYNAVDDFDGDATTPVFFASNSTAWASDGIRSGDTLVIGANSYRIANVASTELTLSDEIPVSTTASGGSYKIVRRVDKVLLRTLTSFFFTQGEGVVVQQQDPGWQSADNNIDPFSSLSFEASLGDSTAVRDLAVSGDTLFAASDVGVFSVTLSDQSTGLPSELLYSASSGGGTYKILANNSATALSVDSDSGHLLIATYNGSSSSEVLEVDVDNFHQKVRSTAGTVEVKSLIGYTNPSGPPTVSV